MPTWTQMQNNLRSPNNPVIFFDITVGNTVSEHISLQFINQLKLKSLLKYDF